MIKTIDRRELLELMRSRDKSVKIIDVLGEDHFRREHIPGAVSLPMGKIWKYAGERLDKNGHNVVYCADFECHAGEKAAHLLEAMGFKHIYDYKGGIEDYKKAGLPVEGSGE